MAIREVNLDEAAARILELERTALTAFAEARALVENARLEREEIKQRRSMVLSDFTEEEAAELLKISYDTLQRERKSCGFPHIKHGTRYYYTAEHLECIRDMRTQNKAALQKWRKSRRADES